MKVLALVVAAAAIVAVACARNSSPARASTPQLVYVCQQVPCANSQELAVADHNGAPIFSVPEYGGPAVLGDNLRIFAPGNVYNPALVFSYTTPWRYAAQNPGSHTETCKAPSKWIAPQGTWLCVAGHWRRIGR